MCVFVFACACSIHRTLPRTSLLNVDGSKLELSYRWRYWFAKNKKYKRSGLILIGGGKLKCHIFSIFYLKNVIPKFETHFSIRISQEVLLIFLKVGQKWPWWTWVDNPTFFTLQTPPQCIRIKFLKTSTIWRIDFCLPSLFIHQCSPTQDAHEKA